MNAKWTPDRIDELKEIATLLDNAGSLNRGNNVVDKIQKCEELSRKLRDSDVDTPRKSFLLFLYAVANGKSGDEL